MDREPRVLAFAGSARVDSYNSKLVKVAAEGARDAGAEVTLVDLRDFPLPLFDQDLEAEGGLPDNARELKEIMLKHDGLLIAAPEYNSSITPLLKNTIDWVSRPGDGEKGLIAYEGKVAAIMSASPGGLGGLRAWFTYDPSSRTSACSSFRTRWPSEKLMRRLDPMETLLMKRDGHQSRGWG